MPVPIGICELCRCVKPDWCLQVWILFCFESGFSLRKIVIWSEIIAFVFVKIYLLCVYRPHNHIKCVYLCLCWSCNCVFSFDNILFMVSYFYASVPSWIRFWNYCLLMAFVDKLEKLWRVTNSTKTNGGYKICIRTICPLMVLFFFENQFSWVRDWTQEEWNKMFGKQ